MQSQSESQGATPPRPDPTPRTLVTPAEVAAVDAFASALARLHPGADDILEQVSAQAFATYPSSFHLVATPQYKGAAADGPFLRWAVVVRSDSAAQALSDLRGRSLGLRQDDLDGPTLLRADVAFLAAGSRFFEHVQPLPDTEAQLEALATGALEAALLDGVSWARLSPQRSNRVRYRLLHWTPRAPAPPLVVRASRSTEPVEPLAQGLERLSLDPVTRREILGPLGIERFHRLPKAQYRALGHYDQIATSQGYEILR